MNLWLLAIIGWGAFLLQTDVGLSEDHSKQDDYSRQRHELIDSVLKQGGIKHPGVLASIASTPRHEFVPLALRDQSYLDRALPIGESQTISSPFIVALMTEVLQPEKTDKVLEIGTGSGYQAAVLSPLVNKVYTIEIVKDLEATTTKLLRRLGYKNIFTKAGDGFLGWEEHAPYDKIIVTCSPDSPPQPLVDQLKEGGLMVIPVGSHYQQLLQVFRKTDNRLIPIFARPTLFVPMTGTAESQRQEASDPTKLKIINGDFEEKTDEKFIPNWYYEFAASLVSDPHAPSGKQVVKFVNHKRGAPSLLLQGLLLDGRVVSKVRLSGYATTSDVRLSTNWAEQPFIVVQFFDLNRNRIGYNWLGPFVGNLAWNKSEDTFEVPPESREAIIMIGLFGAVGSASFDKIEIEATERRLPVK